MLTIKNLKKSYKGINAVDIDYLEIYAGEVNGLVGNNGAGKTTFFRLVLDLIRSNDGEVFSKDNAVTATEDWKSYTSAYIDEGFLIDYLTPEEYFYFVGKLNQLSKADVNDFLHTYLSFFDDAILNKGKYIRDFSKGNQFKIGIIAALLSNPELLILDEPLANLDINAQQTILTDLIFMAKGAHNPMGIILSSQQLHEVEKVADSVIFIKQGNCIYKSSDDEGKVTSNAVEFETKADRESIISLFAEGNIELQFNGGFYTIISAGLSSQQIIAKMIDAKITVTYFRDITYSTKRFF